MKRFRLYLSLFSSSGMIYWLMEIAWKQHSHWSMYFLASCMTVFADVINEITPKMKMWKQSLIFCVFVLTMEYIFGIIFNADYSIWDYRSLKYNLNGMISLQFSFVWLGIAPFTIWYGDWMRGKADANLLEYYKRFFTNK